MAQVVLIFRDKEDGSAGVELFAEPTPHPGQVMTTAQSLGAIALNAVHQELHDQKGGIRIMGADELPI